jgi:hypothetical protein
MRKLFRDKNTGEFLRSNGRWTAQDNLACDFFEAHEIGLEVKARGQWEVEWRYVFDDPITKEWDFSLEVTGDTLAA